MRVLFLGVIEHERNLPRSLERFGNLLQALPQKVEHISAHEIRFTQESWDTVSNWNRAMTMLEQYMSNLQHPVVRAVHSIVDSLEIVCRFSRSTTLHQT
jgi:hypothetical protein